MKPSQERMVFSMSILETKNLKKYYGTEPNITKALDGVTLTVEQGEFVAIVGTSGSGKSTLLNMMGGLDVPTSGNVKVKGKDLSGLNDEQLTIFRRRNIGFIFQNYNLVPVLNVYENIVLPVELDGDTVDKNFIVRAISNSIWFFTYKFVIFPMFVIYPFLIALTVIIPAIIYRKIAKTSIIKRLHQN